MNAYAAAVRRAAGTVDVPGTPRDLRLDGIDVGVDLVRLRWSFANPENPAWGRLLHGEHEFRSPDGDPDETARSWWADVQLAAARRYHHQIDADWLPGQPPVARVWTTDEAWQALLRFLGWYADLRVTDGEIRRLVGTHEVVYRIDPDEWAAMLNASEGLEWPAESKIVPVGYPPTDGIPLWAADELEEARGSGSLIGLSHGRIVNL